MTNTVLLDDSETSKKKLLESVIEDITSFEKRWNEPETKTFENFFNHQIDDHTMVHIFCSL